VVCHGLISFLPRHSKFGQAPNENLEASCGFTTPWEELLRSKVVATKAIMPVAVRIPMR
jgi:hypothetical protein